MNYFLHMKKSLLYFLVAMTMFVAIDAFSANISTKTYSVDAFDAILVQDAIQVVLKKSNVSKVEVETEQDYQEKVSVQVSNKKLVLKTKENKNSTVVKKSSEIGTKVKVYVYYQSLSEVFASGASSIAMQEAMTGEKLLLILSSASTVNFNGNLSWLSVNCSGASKCTISGKYDKLNIQCNGASNINSNAAIANSVDAQISGTSLANISAQKDLVINASGASHVKYKTSQDTKVVTNIAGASTATKI